MNKEELEAKLNSLKEKHNEMLSDLKKLEHEIKNTIDKLNELDDSMVKIICPECFGMGWMKTEEKKKIICEFCDGKGWIWAKKWMS